jgi:hypothetical protein
MKKPLWIHPRITPCTSSTYAYFPWMQDASDLHRFFTWSYPFGHWSKWVKKHPQHWNMCCTYALI